MFCLFIYLFKGFFLPHIFIFHFYFYSWQYNKGTNNFHLWQSAWFTIFSLTLIVSVMNEGKTTIIYNPSLSTGNWKTNQVTHSSVKWWHTQYITITVLSETRWQWCELNDCVNILQKSKKIHKYLKEENQTKEKLTYHKSCHFIPFFPVKYETMRKKFSSYTHHHSNWLKKKLKNVF